MEESPSRQRTPPIVRGLAVVVLLLILVAAAYAVWIGIANYSRIRV